MLKVTEDKSKVTVFASPKIQLLTIVVYKTNHCSKSIILNSQKADMSLRTVPEDPINIPRKVIPLPGTNQT